MIEITENLHRAELTAMERSKLVAEWAELTGDVSRQVDANPEVGGQRVEPARPPAMVRQKRSDRQTWTSSTRTLQPTAEA